MRFEDERYVRLYTRDTLTWKRLGWEGRSVLPQLMRKVDRAGVVEIDEGDPGEALSLLLDMPEEVTKAAWPKLISTGTVTLRDAPSRAIILPNFIEAQEAKASDAARAKKHRELARALKNVTPRSKPSRPVADASRPVTDGHAASRSITPSLAVPSLAVPEEAKATVAGAPASLPLVEKPSEPKPKKPEATPEQEECRRAIRARFEAEWTRRAIAGAEFRWGPAEHNGIIALAALDGEGKGTNPAKGLRALETFIERMAVKNYYRDNFAPRIVAQEINNLRQAVQADRPAARGAAQIQISEEAKADHAVAGRKIL